MNRSTESFREIGGWKEFGEEVSEYHTPPRIQELDQGATGDVNDPGCPVGAILTKSVV
jgi:hypothetical protein